MEKGTAVSSGIDIVKSPGIETESEIQSSPPLNGISQHRSTMLGSTLDQSDTGDSSAKLSDPVANPNIWTSDDIKLEEGTVIHYFDMKGKFHLDQYLQHMVAQIDAKGLANPKMGVTWKDLTVCGKGSGVQRMTSLSSMFTSFPSLFSALKHETPHLKTILNSFEGDLQPGELLLVLGRPGAGCTTFLKTLASYRDGFHSVDGIIDYNGLTYQDIQGTYRGEVVYAPEGKSICMNSNLMIEY
jgi:ATP-binding cassette subfamily G (WHITE) protein 2 (SNQ2)